MAYLIDLSGYVFRAYHAITTTLTSPKGEPTQATMGTAQMLLRLMDERRPQYVAVAMDSVGRTFRHEMDERYKATRPPAPPDLITQMNRSREIIEGYRWPIFQKEGVEADDIIATLVRFLREKKKKAVIVSADKDLMQLVGDDVLLWDTMRNKVFGIAEVKEKFGVEPTSLGDLLALNGDTSDNIPGVPKVGPKTAADLLKQHQDLDGIYAHVGEIKAKAIRESLQQNEADARLSRKLVTLKEDVPLTLSLEGMLPRPPDVPRLQKLLEELGFTKMLARLEALSRAGGEESREASVQGGASSTRSPHDSASTQERPIQVKLITTSAELDAFVTSARGAAQLSIHLETSSPDPMRSALIGLSLAIDEEEGVYIPVGHRGLVPPTQVGLDEVRAKLGPILAAERPLKLGHDVKSEEVVLSRAGLALGAVGFDSMLASYLLDPNAEHGLKETARRELSAVMKSYDEPPKRGTRGVPFDELALEAAAPYAVEGAVLPLRLMPHLKSRLEAESLLRMNDELELPLSRVLATMEQQGVFVDRQALGAIGKTLEERITELEKEAHALVGKPFNLGSPKQLEVLLFDELKLKPIKRTKTSRSTDAEVLEALSEEHPLPRLLLEHRQLSKLKGTYVDALPELIHPQTHRVHTRFNQAVASTGRLSSSDPNLQNIPIRSEVGRAIRSAFIAEPGNLLVSLDYSQIELRILAHLSKDPVLIDAFRAGDDVHARTAMEIFAVSREQVTSDMRRAAKTINFGIIYGMGESALAKRLGVEKTKAAALIQQYFERYAGVRRYLSEVVTDAQGAGSVSTLLGRRRFLPDISSGNRAVRLAAERIAQNTPIQGTAADILKLAMVKLSKLPTPSARMLLTVHDELIFEVKEDEARALGVHVKAIMESVMPMDVPLIVDTGMGRSWADAHS